MVEKNRDGSKEITDEASPENGRMLTRTWIIAANFRSLENYGIPSAPTVTMEHQSCKFFVLFICPTAEEPFLTIDCSMNARR